MRRFVVTIHDLTILHFRTGRATTLPLWIYAIRRLGYSIILSVGLQRAARIFAVSETTKADIIANYHSDKNKIVVTYEGVEPLSSGTGTKRPVDGTYLLYVGNAYPHKNLEKLLEAFDLLHNNPENNKVKLVFVGKEDHFTKRLKEISRLYTSRDSVIFFGEATDTELYALYTHAVAFVFPSHAEGFGLPAIEAMACGCSVICSDIPIFHEILGDRATYVDPNNAEDMKRVIQVALRTTKKPTPYIDTRFDWKKMAEQTLRAYEDSIRV
jgi:glycosyltransferase involved in cell wall biosynthesis